MALCSNSSEYVPTPLVEAFHSIPHRDINLAATSDTFSISLDYFEAVIIWVCIPIVIVLCIFILMSIYFIVVCCCCCCQQHEERSKGPLVGCAVTVYIIIIVAVVCCGVGLWAEFAWYSSLNNAATSASSANDVIQGIQTHARAINFTEAEMSTESLKQAVAASNSSNNGYSMAMNSATLLAEETSALRGAFEQIVQGADVQDLTPVLNTINNVDLTAHWVVVAFLLVTVLVMVLLMLAVCFGACCRSPICPTLTLLLVGVYGVVMWMAVGVNLGYLVLSGDVCADPDALIRSQFNNASTADLPPGTLDYYLVCDESCYANPFSEYQFNATQSLDAIGDFQTSINGYVAANPGSGSGLMDVERDLALVVSSLDGAVLAVSNISVFTNCTQLNTDYLGVLRGFCQDGYLYSLILFAMLCGLAIFFILLMVLGTFYAGLLSKGRIDDEETVVYGGFQDDSPSAWESYGTQQHYRSSQPNYAGYNDGTMNMNNMNSNTLPNDPPKYADLQETSMAQPPAQGNGMRTSGYYET